MSQQNLDKALEIVAALQAQADASLASQLSELQATLQAARQAGEGQGIEELQAQLSALALENSRFISVMVHEIRKPMTSIRGYSDMLGKNVMGELNEMQSQFVETIRRNTISMEALVSDISDLSKLQTGRIKPSPKMEMFKNISMKVEKDMQELAEARGVSLTFEIPQGLPLLNLDSLRVEQALRKLIDNAIKYTHEGQGVVTVTAEGLGDRLQVTVSDNGVGMTESEQARLGELFFRGDNDLVAQTKGYGMGIPIALACAELLEGQLSWESTPGEGTRFTLVLPAMS